MAPHPAPPAVRDKNIAHFANSKQSLTDTRRTCTLEMDRDRIGVWGSGDGQSNSKVSGLDRLKHPGLNKVSSRIDILSDNQLIF